MNDITLPVPIDMVRDLLDGPLSGTCMLVKISSRPHSRRLCVTHRMVEPCASQELVRILRADTRAVEEAIASDREDLLASEDADDV